jgi:phage shock protein E
VASLSLVNMCVQVHYYNEVDLKKYFELNTQKMFDFFKKLTGKGNDYKMLIANGAVIVDVRTAEEFSAGHINGSKNIPLPTVKEKISDLKKSAKPIITVCRSGSRSAVAKSILSGAGIETYNGGAWDALKTKLL